jgi:serine O-acetyltransferase
MISDPRFPSSFFHCLTFDGLAPRSVVGKLIGLILLSGYSSSAWLRLSWYFTNRRILARSEVFARLYALMTISCARANEVLNGVFCDPSTTIGRGLLIKYGNVIITGSSVIESDVTLHSGAYIGVKDGKAPRIREKAIIYGHSIILGGVTIGRGAVVAPGSVVLIDVPDRMIVAGVPAKIIKAVDSQLGTE